MPPHRFARSQPLSDIAVRQMEEIIARFEDAWGEGTPPAIAAYLPTDPEQRHHVLIELVHVDLEFRLKTGERARVEAYLQSFPELADQRDTVLGLIHSEFELRQRLERTCETSEYLERFPQYRSDLETILPASHGRGATPVPEEVATCDVPTADPAATRSFSPQAARLPGGASRDALPDVPGYEVQRVLGRGGMGIVYQARQVQLKRSVALKMILAGHLAGEQERARFLLEAQAVARLRHPNIVQVHEIGEHDGRPFFSLEFVEGGSLDKKLAHTPQPPAEVARLMELLARAMHHAHEHNILHRDLKPANVLLSADGQPKVTDFGLAKKLDDVGQTHTGAIMGTPSYMAPEQAAGRIHELGPAADTYALGAILYEMLTGQPPFKGASLYDTLDLVRNTDPVPPRQLVPKVPADLETICLKCLEKEPGKRYASAADLAEDLRRFLNNEPIRARPVGLLERGVKWLRRNPREARLVGLVAVCALLLIGGAVGAVFYHKEQQLTELTRREELRDKADSDFSQGQKLRRSNQLADLEKARHLLAGAAAALAQEPGLTDRRAEIAEALADVKQRIQAWTTKNEDDANFARFSRLRNDADFQALLAREGDPASNRRALRDLTQRTLAIYGICPGAALLLRLPLSFNEERRVAVAEGLYETLLAHADALARPLPGTEEDRVTQAGLALAVLEQAEQLMKQAPLKDQGLSSQTYHVRRARYLEGAGRQAEADVEKRRADALLPSNVLDQYLAGRDAYQRGDFTEALRWCEQVLQQRMNHFGAALLQANCLIVRKEWRAAQVSLYACLALQPDFLGPRALRALVAGELGLAAEARESPEAAENFAHAEKDYAYVLDHQPDALVAYAALVNRAYLRIRRGDYDNAVPDLKAAIDLKPDQYNAYVNLARALQGQERWTQAIEQLDKAIERAPGLAALYRTRAQLHLLRKDPDATLLDLEAAIEREPRDSTAADAAEDHVQRGKLMQQRRNFAEALACYETALRKRPEHAVALRLQADVLLQLKRPEEALKALDHFIAQGRAPAEVYRMRGLVRSRLRDFRGATADYTLALKSRTDLETLRLRGWAYLADDAAKPALADFDEALRLDPDDAEAYTGRGAARVELDQVRPGVADAVLALRQRSQTATTVYGAARIYALAADKMDAQARTGDRPAQELRQQYEDQALKLLRQALDLQPMAARPAFWAEVAPDPALRPLRRLPAYQQLAAQLAPAEKGPRPEK